MSDLVGQLTACSKCLRLNIPITEWGAFEVCLDCERSAPSNGVVARRYRFASTDVEPGDARHESFRHLVATSERVRQNTIKRQTDPVERRLLMEVFGFEKMVQMTHAPGVEYRRGRMLDGTRAYVIVHDGVWHVFY